MATVYQYLDTYITNSIPLDELEDAETDALSDLTLQGVTDEYYLGKMCQCLVYIELATRQLEAEGMLDRVTQYRAEYKRYSQMNSHEATDSGVFSSEIGRG